MSLYQSERVVEKSVKQNQKEDLKLLIHVFWDVALIQLVNGDLSEKNNVSISSIKQYKENGFLKNLFNLLQLINT